MRALANILSQYGTLVSLILLCSVLSVLTLREQYPEGDTAAAQVSDLVLSQSKSPGRVLIVTGISQEDMKYGKAVAERLETADWQVTLVQGGPAQAKQSIDQLKNATPPLTALVATYATSRWPVLASASQSSSKPLTIIRPLPYRWPTFLKYGNVLNVANQIAVIAIIAVGMTYVIVAGGIDLSVGSLIALASVIAGILIRDLGGGTSASAATLTTASLTAIFACGLLGLLSGVLIIGLEIPPFIVTLSMMMVASGAAFLLAGGNSIPEVPAMYTMLGRGVLRISADLGIPYAVIVMLTIYFVSHLALGRTVWGRHVYAVGDNRRAAWLSGIPVQRVIISTYVLTGLLAGVGGIVMASTYQSGDPRYGQMYELYVIAAVVVGGTSLSGGRGTIFGTLIGALIIGVINNGMNLLLINPYAQKVILGLVILGAVALDRFKKH